MELLFCPKLLVIDHGKIIANNTKHQVFEHPRNFRTAQLTGCKNFSAVEVINEKQIKAIDWDCILDIIEPISEGIEYVGIKAHQFIFPDGDYADNKINVFLCWLTTISETPHRMTLYIKLNQSPNHPEDYHLQAEVFKDKWQELKNRPFPWQIQLHPLKLFLITK